MMRVAHVITGLDTGGAERALYSLLSHTDRSRDDHHVVSLTTTGEIGPLIAGLGIPVEAMRMNKGAGAVRGMIRLIALLRRVRPDLVQTWMYHADLLGGAAARMAGVNAVAWGVRNANLNPAANSRSTLIAARCCAALSNALPKVIIACSRRSAEIHARFGYRADRFRVIPNGCDTKVFVPHPAAARRLRDALGIAQHTRVLGMIARFDPQKDHAALLQALALLKARGTSFCCLLAGSGMDAGNATLRDSIRKNRVEEDVLLLGPRTDIPDIMNALDLHLLSSRGEAFPNVLAEAMACGTPCVTTDVGDAGLIVDQTGWVVPSGDPVALADAVRTALAELDADPEAWKKRRAACRNHIVEHFGMARMAEAYHNIWEQVVNDSLKKRT